MARKTIPVEDLTLLEAASELESLAEEIAEAERKRLKAQKEIEAERDEGKEDQADP